MNERPVAMALLAAPFAYVAADVLTGFGRAHPGAWIGFALLVAVIALFEVGGRAFEGAGALLLVGLGLGTTVAIGAAASLNGVGGDVMAGEFIAVPLVAVSLVWRPIASISERGTGFGLAVAWGIVLLTARGAVVGGVPFSGGAYVTGFFEVCATQGAGLGTLLSGMPPGPLPVTALFDPYFAALVAGAVFGLLVLIVRPQTADGTRLPIATNLARPEEPSVEDLPSTFGFSETQRAFFRARSRPEPAPTTWPPGLLAVAAGASASGILVLLVAVDSRWALFTLTAGLALVGLGLVLVSELPGVIPWDRLPEIWRPRGVGSAPVEESPVAEPPEPA